MHSGNVASTMHRAMAVILSMVLPLYALILAHVQHPRGRSGRLAIAARKASIRGQSRPRKCIFLTGIHAHVRISNMRCCLCNESCG
jgi:hypothetical protein